MSHVLNLGPAATVPQPRSTPAPWAHWAQGALGAGTIALAAIAVYQWQITPPAGDTAAPAAVATAAQAPAMEVAATTPMRMPAPAPAAAPAPTAVRPAGVAQRVPQASSVSAQKTPAPLVVQKVVAIKKEVPNPQAIPSDLPDEQNSAWQRAPAPVGAAASSAPPVPVPGVNAVRSACAECGTVESVAPFTQEGKGSGAGAVAGALLGGLLGNQVGGGDGKTLATMAGVIGGAWAGDTVEKRMKPQTSYRVTVRMDDGSLRTLEQSTPSVGAGARVQIQGGVISPVRNEKGSAGLP